MSSPFWDKALISVHKQSQFLSGGSGSLSFGFDHILLVVGTQICPTYEGVSAEFTMHLIDQLTNILSETQITDFIALQLLTVAITTSYGNII